MNITSHGKAYFHKSHSTVIIGPTPDTLTGYVTETYYRDLKPGDNWSAMMGSQINSLNCHILM